MARPRKPTELLKTTGAFLKNPDRARADPKTTGPVGSAPAHWDGLKVAIWNEIVANAPMGVLNNSSRHAVEMLAHWVHEFRTGDNWTAGKDQRLHSWLIQLGMTPASISKVNAKDEAPADPTAAYFN